MTTFGLYQEDPRTPAVPTRNFGADARPRARTHGALVATAPLDGFSNPVSWQRACPYTKVQGR